MDTGIVSGVNADSGPGPASRTDDPATPLREVPWGFIDAVLVFALTYLLAGLLSPALTAVFEPEVARGLFFPLSLLVLGVTTLGYVRLRFPEHLRALFGQRSFTWRHVGAGLLHGLAAFFVINVGFAALVQLVVSVTGGELPTAQEGLREATRDERIGYLVIASSILVAPVAEELFFRGFLFQALRRRIGVWPGIGISAYLFGLAHFQGFDNISGTLYALVVLSTFGMYLAWMLQRRGHVATTMTMHLVFNALATASIVITS
jgi:uncharacterized protein